MLMTRRLKGVVLIALTEMHIAIGNHYVEMYSVAFKIAFGMNQLIARNSLLPNINIHLSSLLLLNMKVCVLMYLYQMLQQFIHSPLYCGQQYVFELVAATEIFLTNSSCMPSFGS